MKILITGGDGYIGHLLAGKFLKYREPNLLLWSRACGDLREENPFRSVDTDEISGIVHSAAVTRFNVDRQTAEEVNIQGTRKILQFATQCSHLQSFNLLSTIYSSGLTAGEIHESAFQIENGFSNFYEWSKCSAENLLLTDFSALPWRILRVSTVIADDIDGQVTQQNAFHNTLKLIYYGLLSLIPGNPQTPLYFVTGDFVAEAIFQLIKDSPLQTIYHVCHKRAESLTLGRLIEIVYATFEEYEDFRKKHILKPLFSDQESFGLLADAATKFGGAVVNQAVSSVSPFSKQLFVNKDVKNENLIAIVKDYMAPDPVQLIANTARYLVRTKWGRSTADGSSAAR